MRRDSGSLSLATPISPHFSSLQLLRKCILQMTRPVVEGSLGSPPFEKPNIEQVGRVVRADLRGSIGVESVLPQAENRREAQRRDTGLLTSGWAWNLERSGLPGVRGSLALYLRCLCWLFTHTPPPPFAPFPPSQGVLNFVQYKFSHLAPRERQTMFELSKMFLLCLNYWKLETPAQFRQRSQSEDVATYKVNYTR